MYHAIGRFPFLITIASIFIAGTMQGIGASIVSTLAVLFVILLGIFANIGMQDQSLLTIVANFVYRIFI